MAIVLKVKKVHGLAKTQGLIRKQPTPLHFSTRFGIHTFFLRRPIDVLILNKQKEVVYIKEHMVPNRIYFWNPFYDTVVELPQGWVRKKKIRRGSKLTLRIL